MSGRKKKFNPPKGFTVCPKLRADYEENGKQFGRFYLWYPERALKAWSMLAGVLGPRWKLEVYRHFWIQENPEDYRKWKKARELKARALKRQQADKLDK